MTDDTSFHGLPPLPRPPTSMEQHWLAVASCWAVLSTDPILRSGCVAIRGERLLAAAHDRFPAGTADTSSRRRNKDTRDAQLLSAPQALIADAAHYGISLVGSDVYSWPLPPCARDTSMLIHSGCRHIYYPDGVPIPSRLDDDVRYAIATAAAAGVPRIAIEPELL
jgi:deoxycytidylate deaminase